MIENIKYVLFVCICVFATFDSLGNSIDSLQTKDDVKRFLSICMSKNEEYSSQCYNISRAQSRWYTSDDMFSEFFKFDMVALIMDKFPFRIFKTDIDQNGRTDLIVDAGYLFVVMDAGNTYKLHALGFQYNFRKALLLPNGSTALLLKHDYNRRIIDLTPQMNVKIAYITDTITRKDASPPVQIIDTLYITRIGSYTRDTYWKLVSTQ